MASRGDPFRPPRAELSIRLRDGAPVRTVDGRIFRGADPFDLLDRWIIGDRDLRQSFPRFSEKLEDGVRLRRGQRIDGFLRLRFFAEDPAAARGVAAEIRRLVADVASVTMVGRPHAASPGAVEPGDLTGHQRYLDPAPLGIDAKHAWRLPGGDGSGVNVGVADLGYCAGPIDLPPGRVLREPDSGVSLADQRHGTNTLGVLGAPEDDRGMTGIAHGASFYFASVRDGAAGSIEEALDLLFSTLGEGDVVVLECDITAEGLGYAKSDGTALGMAFVPVETVPDLFGVIAEATAAGISVVEPAGNGSAELIAVYDAGVKIWDPVTSESGAVLVGSAHPEGPAAHSWDGNGNYGIAVDCHAWGENVATPTCEDEGPGTLIPDTGDYNYVSDYGKTSAASAIVAGAVACLQGAYHAHPPYAGGWLTAGEIRKMLRNPALGTRQTGAEHIGPQPDLFKLLCHIGLCPDIHVRDHVLDTGALPATDLQYRCPDVYLKRDPAVPDPDTMLTSGGGWMRELFPQPLLGPGPFHVYARALNSGFAPAEAEVRMWWAEPGAFVHPSYWRPISSGFPADMGLMPWKIPGYVQVGWDEPLPAPPGATTMSVDEVSLIVAVRRTPGGPAHPDETATTDEFLEHLRDHNTLRIRNVQTGVASSGSSPAHFRFHFRGVPEGPDYFHLIWTPNLPPGATARVSVDQPLYWLSPTAGHELYPFLQPGSPWIGSPTAPLILWSLHLDTLSETVFALDIDVPADTPNGVWDGTVDQALTGKKLGRAWFHLIVKGP